MCLYTMCFFVTLFYPYKRALKGSFNHPTKKWSKLNPITETENGFMEPKYHGVLEVILHPTLGPQKPMKNEGFTPQNMGKLYS